MRTGPLLDTLLISAGYCLFYTLVQYVSGLWAEDWVFEVLVPSSCEDMYPDSPLELRNICAWHVTRNTFAFYLSLSFILAGLFLACLYPFRARIVLKFSPKYLYLPPLLVFLVGIFRWLIPAGGIEFLSGIAQGMGTTRFSWMLVKIYIWEVLPLILVYLVVLRSNKAASSGVAHE